MCFKESANYLNHSFAIISLVLSAILIFSHISYGKEAHSPLRSMGCPTEYFLIQDLADAFKKLTGQTVLAGAKNTSKGLIFLSKGKLDFSFSCRPTDIMQEKLNIDPEIVERWEVLPLAVEPIVFVVHKDIGVDSLSLEQIREIFFGNLDNWKPLTQQDLQVKPVTYGVDEISGMEIILRETVLRPISDDWRSLPFSETIRIKLSEPTMLGYYVNKTPGSIGYFGFAHLNRGYRQHLGKIIRVNGVEPTLENIVNGSYPFSARYRIVYDKTKVSTSLKKFLEFVKSEDGKKVINQKFIAVDDFSESDR